MRAAIIAEHGSWDAYLLWRREERLRKNREYASAKREADPAAATAAWQKGNLARRARNSERLIEAQRKLAEKGILSLVYFLQSGPGGPIKIGFTAQGGLRQRVRSLQTGNPNALEILGVIGAAKSVETDLHWRFRHIAVGGGAGTEWFNPEPDLLAYIRDHAVPWTDENEETSRVVEEAKRRAVSEEAA